MRPRIGRGRRPPACRRGRSIAPAVAVRLCVPPYTAATSHQARRRCGGVVRDRFRSTPESRCEINPVERSGNVVKGQ
jgi:hypothetical protein